MELFFELTRRCNMQCAHCLRGDAQGIDMPAEIMRTALIMFSEHSSKLGFGGGEALLKPDLIHTFAQELSWCRNNFEQPMWIVSNGKRFLNQFEPSIPYNDPYYFDDENDAYENIPLVEAIERLSKWTPIQLAISTDSFHDKGSEARKNHAEYLFENNSDITVQGHGPDSDWGMLLNMGNAAGSAGRELDVYSPIAEDNTNAVIYIDVHGYIWPDCNFSYTFMEEFKDTRLCLGNVLTDTYENVRKNMDVLDDILLGQAVSVSESYIDEFLELEEDYEKELKKEISN